jgi:aspartyl-tRNA(Asn)/glutamyl-tRNA(Gln) amidotransferase subunit A
VSLHELSIRECGRRLRDGSLTSTALTRHHLDRIAALDGPLHGFNTVAAEAALAEAEAADRALAAGEDKGPLHGIPYGVKDIYDTAGVLTSCQSHLRKDHVPDRDCTAVARLRAGGAVLLGKNATIEFATGGPSDETFFPPARNPWNLDHVPGGSSSGSGASVAAGLCRMSMGSDTGGSIRGPASLCGTVGIKATYGRVSRRGVFPLSYTLDHCGPLAWTVEDAALALQVVAGHDPEDPASADVPVPDYTAGLDGGVDGLRIGFVRSFLGDRDDVDPAVATALDDAAAQLEALGAVVEDVALPPYDLFHAAGRTILLSECYAVHEQDLKTRPELYGRPTRERLMVGAFVRGSDYVQAQRVRRELAQIVERDVFARYDVLLAPSAIKPAGRFDAIPDGPLGPMPMMTIPFNVTGHPAMALCCGFTAEGLPLSMQLVGRPFDEATLFRAGRAYERATDWRARRPAGFARPGAADDLMAAT